MAIGGGASTEAAGQAGLTYVGNTQRGRHGRSLGAVNLPHHPIWPGRGSWCGSSMLLPSILPLGPSMTHCTPPETLTTLPWPPVPSQALRPSGSPSARPCRPPTHLTLHLDSQNHDSQEEPPSAPQAELPNSQGTARSPQPHSQHRARHYEVPPGWPRRAILLNPCPTPPHASGEANLQEEAGTQSSLSPRALPRKAQEALGAPSSRLGTSGKEPGTHWLALQDRSQRVLMSESLQVRHQRSRSTNEQPP